MKKSRKQFYSEVIFERSPIEHHENEYFPLTSGCNLTQIISNYKLVFIFNKKKKSEEGANCHVNKFFIANNSKP